MTALTEVKVTDQALLDALRRAGVGDVDGSGLARALYSSDASLYRVLPRVVVRPRHPDEIVAALDLKTEREKRRLLMQKWSWVGEGRLARGDARKALKRRIEEELDRFAKFQLGD